MPVITYKQAVKKLDVSTIYKYVDKREIKHIKYPDKIVFELDEIYRFKQKYTVLNLF